MSNLSKTIIGITGTIASGKSQITKYLLKKGYLVIDSDALVAKMYLDNEEFKKKLITLLGKKIVKDNQIDKKIVASLVFNDEALLKQLNELSHPIIINIIRNELLKHKGLVFIDAPLLYESKFDAFCDYVIVVSTNEHTQIERLKKRDKLSVEDARKRVASQQDQSEKVKKADFVLDNNGTLKNLFKQVDEILNNLERGN